MMGEGCHWNRMKKYGQGLAKRDGAGLATAGPPIAATSLAETHPEPPERKRSRFLH